jgi:hypothetical protein
MGRQMESEKHEKIEARRGKKEKERKKERTKKKNRTILIYKFFHTVAIRVQFSS